MSYAILAGSVLGFVIYAAGCAGTVTGALPAKWFWGSRLVADGIEILCQVAQLDQDGRRFSVWVSLFLGYFAFDWWQWRKHRDDDDDQGERLRSWARSHLPRPQIIRIRPVQDVAS
jgi:hypothetical protein